MNATLDPCQVQTGASRRGTTRPAKVALHKITLPIRTPTRRLGLALQLTFSPWLQNLPLFGPDLGLDPRIEKQN
jgi:hypothetical protein